MPSVSAIENPGPFHAYIGTGPWGNFLGFFSTFVGAAYAYGGPDYIAMTAGEAKYPRRIYPNVFSRVIWRLLVFYIGGVLAVGILVRIILKKPCTAAQCSSMFRILTMIPILVLPRRELGRLLLSWLLFAWAFLLSRRSSMPQF